jgi:hypothetical protein
MALRIERKTNTGWIHVGDVKPADKRGFIRFPNGKANEGLIFGPTSDDSKSLIYQTDIEYGAWLMYRQRSFHGRIPGLKPMKEIQEGQSVKITAEELGIHDEFQYRFTHRIKDIQK